MNLTDDCAVGKTELVARDSLEMRNDSVSGVAVSQSILGRILSYGTIEVRGEEADGVRFGYIKKPEELRNTMQKYLADVADEAQ
ncbi:PH domain-containing protein [Salinibacter grassmerensis]|uniref:PH domain-containing protein n=1 Tax=Salinibacter grassmerensis TaxID=3040353 RepID=UPI0021E720F6|nr:PH domain-containing protein [Salinibacter grassmerensis]